MMIRPNLLKWTTLGVLGMLCSTMCLIGAEGLSSEDLEPGDKMLLESVSGTHAMYHLGQKMVVERMTPPKTFRRSLTAEFAMYPAQP